MKKIDVIEAFGGAAVLADRLGISRQAVHKWPDDVPPLRVYQIRCIARGDAIVIPSDDARGGPA